MTTHKENRWSALFYKNPRLMSVLPLAFFFGYVLSFLFEGQVFYSIATHFNTDPISYVMVAVTGQFVGLLSAGFFVKTGRGAKGVMLVSMILCLLLTLVFFFPPSGLWPVVFAICSIASGCVNTCWGYFLKTFTPKIMRIKSCADNLIIANILMIVVNYTAVHFSPFIGLIAAMTLIVLALFFTIMLPVEKSKTTDTSDSAAENDQMVSWKIPLAVLFIFVTVITINSGLMYQMIIPAFAHLTQLTSWYWAVPYIAALLVMRNLPPDANRSTALYVGMGMIMASFIFFMLLGRDAPSYLVVNTLMLGACGIFDLFWWSILGEMLDNTRKPILIFGIGISANVFGILIGNFIALGLDHLNLPVAHVTVIALSVVCVTLIILPPLNHQLLALLKSHVYLRAFSQMPQVKQQDILQDTQSLDPLTPREKDVLSEILSGKTNKAIAASLSVSENTVKTHIKNIYSKYDVNSRSELIALVLKNRTP